MAERLQVSRVPLREALKVLQSEGVLLHRPNQGYFVAKLRAQELAQIYLMRQLVESEILRTIEWPDASGLREIADHNQRLAEAIERDELGEIVAHNRRFHFAIFALSPLDLLGREVDRLWSMSDTYRSVYLYDSGARQRILREHGEILGALESRDGQALVRLCDAHREALPRHLAGLVGRTAGD